MNSVPGRERRRTALTTQLENRPRLFLALFTCIYFYGAICSASRKNFFFDEVITSSLGDLPRIGQIWPMIARGIELNPPLPFWIVWTIHHTIGGGEITSRLPAIAGFWLMCFCLFHFVRRRCGVVFGFVALLLPVFTYAASDSLLSRGYGLMLGMSALALLSWQLATDNVRRPLALAGVAIGIAGAVSCHYYAAYVAGAIGAGELLRTFEKRKPDFGIWLALLIGLSPLAAYAQLLRSAASGASQHFWVSPTAKLLYDTYADLLGALTMVFLLLLVFMVWPDRSPEENEAPWISAGPGRHELAVCFLLAAMPLIVYVAAVFFPVPFYSKYIMPVVIGFTTILAMFAHRIGGGHARFRDALLSLLIFACMAPWALWQSFKVIASPLPRSYVQSHRKLPVDTPLPLVFDSSDSDYLDFYYYGTPEFRSKIFVLLNSEAAIKYRGSDTAQRSLAVAQSFRELHAVEYRKFLAEHPEFLVIRMREEGWLVQSLLGDGAQMQLVSLEKDQGFLVDSASVFHVTSPGGGR